MTTSAEALRVINICNACRYCEGHCAVFPAITRQLTFEQEDIERLSHLCHQCGACYEHCQYAPPHEFSVNLPTALGQVREQSYLSQLQPQFLGNAFRQGFRFTLISLLISISLFLIGIVLDGGIRALSDPQEDFYQLIPHTTMAGIFSIAAAMVIAVWWQTVRQLKRGLSNDTEKPIPLKAITNAFIAAMTLKNLQGGHNEGCYETGEIASPWRRRFHQTTLAGFTLCFLATISGTAYHYLFDTPAPYGFLTLPKLLGMPGGLLLLIGTAGLLIIRQKTSQAIQVDDNGSGASLTLLLFLTALSGLILPFAGPGKGLLLGIHLGIVLALFINFACGKFLHAVFRLTALILDEAEKLYAAASAVETT